MDTETNEKKVEGMSWLSTPMAIVLAGALVAGALYASGSRGGAVAAAPQGSAPAAAAAAVDVKDVKITASVPYIGRPNARLTMAYWSDYQCPFCKQFETVVLPTLIKEYVDTGKLRIVFKDFPFLGDDSTTAALYKYAVWEAYPDKFFLWQQAMFKSQDDEGDRGFGDEASILKLIGTIPGMDANTLKALVAKNKDAYTKNITEDRDEGAKMGIQGTPGFVIGNQMIAGALPLENFKATIDALLAK